MKRALCFVVLINKEAKTVLDWLLSDKFIRGFHMYDLRSVGTYAGSIDKMESSVYTIVVHNGEAEVFGDISSVVIHDECRYIDTRVFTLEELLKEDIPKSTAWFALRIREGTMYAVLTEIRVTEGTIISYYEWEDLLKEIRLSEIPEVRKHPVVECMTW